MKKYLLLTLPALALAAPAYAQDTAGPVGGVRVEAILGYDVIGYDEDEEDLGPGDPRGDLHGLVYGGAIGFDVAMGAAMFGVDAEYTDTTADRIVFYNSGPPLGIRPLASVEFGRDLYIGGRATFAMSPTLNAYVKAGYSNLRASVNATDPSLEDELEDEDIDLDTTLDGIRGALGIQYSPENGPTYYGVEVRYSNYENGVDRKQAALVVGIRF